MLKLFLAGDVMLGRGIDQVMPQSVDPRLFERNISSAESYVLLAETANGPIPRAVEPDYVWGDALEVIDKAGPDCRIVNLETAVTTNPAPWHHKHIHYRMHPANVAVLQAARIDVCALANNHVLDWGERGLLETLDSLHARRIATCGAGRNGGEAQAPAIIERASGRVIVLGFASTTSGTLMTWAAGPGLPGVNVVEEYAPAICDRIAEQLAAVRRPGDVVVVSVHWGTNYGYEIPDAQRRLAHALIDQAGADIVFGHSSHHPRAVELHGGKLILYGAGDFVNDYEGITGHEEFRKDLVLGWFVTIDPQTGLTRELTMAPFVERRFRLTTPSSDEVAWLAGTLDRHSHTLGVRVDRTSEGTLRATPHADLGQVALDLPV